jgi:hypothetical protein
MSNIIYLSDKTPLAIGDHKAVYFHPESPDLLIKTVHEAGLEALKSKYPWSMRFRRVPNYWEFVHEIIEHLAVREQLAISDSYIETVVGLVDTDLGVGMVVEAIRTPEGEIAPTIRKLIESKSFSEKHYKALDEVLNWIVNTNVIIRELTTTNVVWDEKNNRFVIIDGVGSKPLVTLRSFSKRYNKSSNLKKTKKLRGWIEAGIKKHASL